MRQSFPSRKATITTRLACFGNDPEIVASFRRALQDEARDAISIRFLIEYIAAAPPRGLLPMTLERFDEMLMLASEMTNFGTLSDTVRNDLADLKLSVVASGRLGIRGDQYKKVSNDYMEAFAGHELARCCRHPAEFSPVEPGSRASFFQWLTDCVSEHLGAIKVPYSDGQRTPQLRAFDSHIIREDPSTRCF